MSSGRSRDHTSLLSDPVCADPLLPYSIEDAAYDLNTLDPRDLCLPGTRTQYIERVEAWAGDYEQCRRFLWIQGPAGAGKTTIARSCARGLEKREALGASFFFSYDKNVIDPSCFFSTIAQQLAKHNSHFKFILDRKIYRDPTLPTRRMEVQLEELIIQPLLELQSPVQRRVVVVDGLHDCDGSHAQFKLVELIASSIKKYRNRIPLLWAFFCRPEPHIIHVVDTLSSHSSIPFLQQIFLSVSCELTCIPTCEHNTEIRAYLRSALQFPQQSVNSHVDGPSQWPSDENLNTLVKMSARLFIYAAIIANFITDSSGPLSRKRRLEGVLSLESRVRPASASTFNPLIKLDAFYRRIMERIPGDILFLVQQVLLLHVDLVYGETKFPPPARFLANLSGLDLESLEHTLSKLQSVLILKQGQVLHSEWGSSSIFFYHPTFIEYLTNPERSREFWIKDKRLWSALAVRGLRLLYGMSRVKDISNETRTLEVKKLLSAVPNSAYPMSSFLKFQEELYDKLCRNVTRWCACSGLDDDGSEVLQELHHIGLETLRGIYPEIGHLFRQP